MTILLIFGILMQGTTNIVHQMKGTQFPFGVLNVENVEIRKMFVRKRYTYRTNEEYQQLKHKIQRLKGISHKNTINLRSAQEKPGVIDLFYQYVPFSLQGCFNEQPNLTVKVMHRQFIELAIYLAKNCILTTFNPERCGIVINENRSLLKYYLPLQDITITNNISMLERSVQLFNVQSMHYLDTLQSNQTLNSTINDSQSQRTFKNRVKLFGNEHKTRRDSQPNGFSQQNWRKLSNNPQKINQNRKLSSLSREFSQITEIHKRHRESTRVSGGSFNTFQSILSFKSHKNTSVRERSQDFSNSGEDTRSILKKCQSQNMIGDNPQISSVIARSKKALNSLRNIRQNIRSYKGLYEVIKKIRPQL